VATRDGSISSNDDGSISVATRDGSS